MDLALLIAYVENYEARMGHGPSAVRVSYRQWANVVSLLTPTEKPCLLGLPVMLKESTEGPIDATGCANTFGTHFRHLQPRGHHPNHTTNG